MSDHHTSTRESAQAIENPPVLGHAQIVDEQPQSPVLPQALLISLNTPSQTPPSPPGSTSSVQNLLFVGSIPVANVHPPQIISIWPSNAYFQRGAAAPVLSHLPIANGYAPVPNGYTPFVNGHPPPAVLLQAPLIFDVPSFITHFQPTATTEGTAPISENASVNEHNPVANGDLSPPTTPENIASTNSVSEVPPAPRNTLLADGELPPPFLLPPSMRG